MYRHYQNKERYSLAEAERLLSQAYESAAILRRDCDSLPPVTDDGSSECPFAEQVYFDKDKTALFVREDLEQLRRYARDAASLAGICEHQLKELVQKRSGLNSEEPSRHMQEAEEHLHNQMKLHQRMHRDLKEAIAEVEATLREARERKFPGRPPRGPFGEELEPKQPKPRPLEDMRKEGLRWQLERARRFSDKLGSDDE